MGIFINIQIRGGRNCSSKRQNAKWVLQANYFGKVVNLSKIFGSLSTKNASFET